MISNNLKEMRIRLDALKADNLAEIAKTEKQIETAKKALEEANAAAADAYARANIKSYHKAGDDRRTAEDMIEMFSTKLCRLETEPLISEAEYKDGIATVMSELDDVLANAKSAMLPIVEQAEDIKARVLKAVAFGESILHDFQHDIFKDDACSVNSKGERCYSRFNEVQFDRSGHKVAGIVSLVNMMTGLTKDWGKE